MSCHTPLTRRRGKYPVRISCKFCHIPVIVDCDVVNALVGRSPVACEACKAKDWTRVGRLVYPALALGEPRWLEGQTWSSHES